MWPFKNSTAKNHVKQQATTLVEDVLFLKQHFPAGREFIYFDRVCIVAALKIDTLLPDYASVELRINYCDDNGVIHSLLATVPEMKAILTKEHNRAWPS